MTSFVGTTRTVSHMGTHLSFVCDSQDVQSIKEYLSDTALGYDSFFVAIADGDYAEVWGMVGIVPFKSKLVRRLL